MPTPEIQTLIDRASDSARYCLNLRDRSDLVLMQQHLTPEEYQQVLAYWLHYCAASSTIHKDEAIRLRIPRPPRWEVGDLVSAGSYNAPVVSVFYRTGWRPHWEIWTPGLGRGGHDVLPPRIHQPTRHYRKTGPCAWTHVHTTPPLAPIEQPITT